MNINTIEENREGNLKLKRSAEIVAMEKISEKSQSESGLEPLEPVKKKIKTCPSKASASVEDQYIIDLTSNGTDDEPKSKETVDNTTQVKVELGSTQNSDTSNASSLEIAQRMTEVDVGVTEYLGSHSESFTAIIKQRYSDFIVNEIDEDGNIVHLKNINYEDEKDDREEEKGTSFSENNEKSNSDEPSVLCGKDLAAMEKIVADKTKTATYDIIAPEDKQARTQLHLAIKQNFPQLETKTTQNKEGNKVIQASWRTGRARDAARDEWPKSKKSCRYVRFVLYKENKDTMDAIGLIAKNLRVRESMFQYSGTKDKRAKTSQEITAHRIHPKKLVSLNKVLWNMGLGDFRYVEQPLQLGQLKGNRFVIVLRNVQKSESVVDSALTSLKSDGFINYFGMQRFGTTSIPTHSVGSALLKGDWDKAVDLILSPRNDVPAKDKFQKVWAETRDPAKTLEATPRFCGLERNILEALAKNAKPFNALEKLARNTRLLYVHSYQSLVWNKMASKRLSRLGHKVVAGDLVMQKDQAAVPPSPTHVTAETVDQYSLCDLVLPLPGHDVIYPTNQVGQWYRDQLVEDGLDIDSLKRPQKDYSLPGAYRPLVVVPTDVTWSHHRYHDHTKSLTLSDLDLIQGKTIEDVGKEGKLSAVVLSMSLPSSCYATMALREAMRVDTSSFQQAAMNPMCS